MKAAENFPEPGGLFPGKRAFSERLPFDIAGQEAEVPFPFLPESALCGEDQLRHLSGQILLPQFPHEPEVVGEIARPLCRRFFRLIVYFEEKGALRRICPEGAGRPAALLLADGGGGESVVPGENPGEIGIDIFRSQLYKHPLVRRKAGNIAYIIAENGKFRKYLTEFLLIYSEKIVIMQKEQIGGNLHENSFHAA